MPRKRRPFDWDDFYDKHEDEHQDKLEQYEEELQEFGEQFGAVATEELLEHMDEFEELDYFDEVPDWEDEDFYEG